MKNRERFIKKIEYLKEIKQFFKYTHWFIWIPIFYYFLYLFVVRIVNSELNSFVEVVGLFFIYCWASFVFLFIIILIIGYLKRKVYYIKESLK